MRHLLKCSEDWKHNPPQFVRSMIIYEESGQTFLAYSQERYLKPITHEQLGQLSGREVQLDAVWPMHDDRFTVQLNTTGLYVKKPNIMEIAIKGPDHVKQCIFSEALMFEMIKEAPHPNIAQYRGCLVENGRIKGIVFERYDSTLYQRHATEQDLDKDKIVSEVGSGLRHLHSLGIVHGDLQPGNIMFDQENTAVIIDLDSARREGEKFKVEDKRGSKYFTRDCIEVALRENDYFSLARIKDFIEGGMSRVLGLEPSIKGPALMATSL